MRIGIIFGGKSREREVSFAGGRTVYDNLDKSIFTPVPIFVDSLGHFILLDWANIYKGTIRDFYPPAAFLPEVHGNYQMYVESLQLSEAEIETMIKQVGQPIMPHALPQYIDVAFLTLHGPYGEDGSIQGLLEWLDIPYTGSGILPSAIGISKTAQKRLFSALKYPGPAWTLVQYQDSMDVEAESRRLAESLGLPYVLKAPHQGSSIGIGIVKEAGEKAFREALYRASFIQRVGAEEWLSLDQEARRQLIIRLSDIREGLGLPIQVEPDKVIHQPLELEQYLNETLKQAGDEVQLKAWDREAVLLAEAFIAGREFSCIVVEDVNGEPLALPPTEIVKRTEVYDYKSKYLPGISRKVTPMEVSDAVLLRIREQCCQLFRDMQGQVYARIDGFLTADGHIFLNDPNTTSGMLPSSFFFHQAAEIGLNPSQFITYIIERSLHRRKPTPRCLALRDTLKEALAKRASVQEDKLPVAVIMGGFSSERHISVESGRNIYEKLSSSVKYMPIPVFLSGNEQEHILHRIPIQVMLKDNADDIKDYIQKSQDSPILLAIREEAKSLRQRYGNEDNLQLEALSYAQLAERCQAAFIALHGRPGEDGAVQAQLEQVGLPYNGSGVASSQITINKFETNELLAKHGLLVAGHQLVHEQEWLADKQAIIERIEARFAYPFIAKPADDGCSSAVKKIKSRADLEAFAALAFRKNPELLQEPAHQLQLKLTEEFPIKQYFLIEDLIGPDGASRFLEVTGGLYTSLTPTGERSYVLFEASEALAQGEVLSLEEKFLAGEGQNITPARYHRDPAINQQVSNEVKKVLQRTAEILQVEGYARIDAFVRVFEDLRVEVIIIEVNSLPGMTPATCIFHQAAIASMKPYEFIDAILEYGMQRAKWKQVN